MFVLCASEKCLTCFLSVATARPERDLGHGLESVSKDNVGSFSRISDILDGDV